MRNTLALLLCVVLVLGALPFVSAGSDRAGSRAYENWESCYNEVPGTAEDLGNGLVAMLNNLYEAK